MGLEATCEARAGRRVSKGKALLEAEELVFRGDFRLRIPFKTVKSVRASQGQLQLELAEGWATFVLGPRADKWALKIRSPRGLLDKLGVKPGSRISVFGLGEESFRAQLRTRTQDLAEGRALRGSDLIFVAMTRRQDLPRLERLRGFIKPHGAIWVLWPKGRRAFREDDVRAAGPEMGLVDVKVVSFSETLSALKMVIPVSQR